MAAALAALVATATCVEQPTAPRGPSLARGPGASAAAVTGIVHTLLTSGISTVRQKVCSTASISPAANALVTVAVMGHHGPLASPPPAVSGGGMASWTLVATVTFDKIASPQKRVSVYRALSPSPGRAPLQIAFANPQANCEWLVSQWQGVEASGTNGAGAIAQVDSARGDAVKGLVVNLSGFLDSRDVAYGVFGVRNQAAVVTPGTGFTEIAEWPSGGNPPSSLEAAWTAGDNTIDAQWPKGNAGALGLEIRAAGLGEDSVATVVVTPDSATAAVGDTLQLAAATLDIGGEPLTGRAITWSTNDAQVATVSGSGVVTAAAVGAATITATSEGKSGTAQITVTAAPVPVASIDVTPSAATVAVGSSVQLTATPKDSAGQPLSGRLVTWMTDASQVASVSGAGLVTGVTAGTALVTAASEGKQDASSVTVTESSPATVEGAWSPLKPSPIIQLHLHLLPNGKVLSWGHAGSPQVWDPATGSFMAVPSPSLLFCAGHDFLADGRLLVAGGHITNNHGLPNTNIFDAATASWQTAAPMAQGRWYPTTTMLPSGDVLVLSGQDEAGDVAEVPEIWDGTAWRELTTASLALQNYPRTFVAPDGRIFYAGAGSPSRWLDVSGTGAWSLGPRMGFGQRGYGSAVMYAPGKILYVGGGNPPTNTAEIIDLNNPTPQWTFTGSMAYARWNLNATLLPTGDVLVTGGTSKGDRADPSGAVNVAEVWNPTSGQWTQLATAAPLLRGYHSTSLLLPDGRVLHSGGGDGASIPDNFNYELYSPPYLFGGARPVVTGGVPQAAGYGQRLAVTTPDAATISKVTLIRLGSVTHAFDQAQRLVPAAFSQVAGGLSVSLPSSPTMAPPGPYMLFLVTANGIPSVGRILLLQ
jgi:hypothetical protein